MEIKPRARRTGAIEIEAASAPNGEGRRAGFVRFGSVKVRSLAPGAEEQKRNIEAGQLALRRAKKAFIKAGVSLSHGKDVPRFHVDPNQPEFLIRQLGGRVERGRLVDGLFVAAE